MTYRRYTTLPILLDTLVEQRLAIVGYESWVDYNDRRSLDIYKEKRPDIAFLGALCLTKEKNPTFHHWKIYADGMSGVCIIFKHDEFDKFCKSLDGDNFRFGDVIYAPHTGNSKNIEKGFQKAFEKVDLNNIPFLKRSSFKAENEFRILYSSSDKNQRVAYVDFDVSIIERIVLSPFMTKGLAESVEKAIHRVSKVPMTVTHSTLTNSGAWQRALSIYAARGELEDA